MIALFLVIVMIISLLMGSLHRDDELITCICTFIFIITYLALFIFFAVMSDGVV